jgi:leucyl/phenylalanyl-tRNA--protein transferase
VKNPLDPVTLLLDAYRAGVFPMAEGRDGAVSFYEADPRSILPLDDGALQVSRSLRSAVNSGRFTITADTDFEAVIRACAEAPREGTWINDWIIDTYTRLYSAGHAHSIEARRDGLLVGGLYGVHIGGAFFGESMFSSPGAGGRDASKVCLVHLWHHLRRQGFSLLDTQIANPHMRQFGIVEVRRAEYLKCLTVALQKPAAWGNFTPSARIDQQP